MKNISKRIDFAGLYEAIKHLNFIAMFETFKQSLEEQGRDILSLKGYSLNNLSTVVTSVYKAAHIAPVKRKPRKWHYQLVELSTS